MREIPSAKENPTGLHRRYVVSKTSGEPVDPRAIYFVLRIDQYGDDAVHLLACRAAARRYAEFVQSPLLGAHQLSQVGAELLAIVNEIEHNDSSAANDQRLLARYRFALDVISKIGDNIPDE